MARYTNSASDRDRQNSLASATGLECIAPIYLTPEEELHTHDIADGVSGIRFLGGWRIAATCSTVRGDVLMSRVGAPDDVFGVARCSRTTRAASPNA